AADPAAGASPSFFLQPASEGTSAAVIPSNNSFMAASVPLLRPRSEVITTPEERSCDLRFGACYCDRAGSKLIQLKLGWMFFRHSRKGLPSDSFSGHFSSTRMWRDE